MNKQLILNYINKIKKEDINSFSLKQGISLTDNELNIIYDYLKNDSIRLLNNPLNVINEIKEKVNNNVYNKIIELYEKYKLFLN